MAGGGRRVGDAARNGLGLEVDIPRDKNDDEAGVGGVNG